MKGLGLSGFSLLGERIYSTGYCPITGDLRCLRWDLGLSILVQGVNVKAALFREVF